MKPTNQPPTRGKWFTAGFLTMIADITGTLAQFMPMKAVFILAADDIPSFFPSILVNAGPILTGLALVLAAAVLAIISKFAKDLALTRSGANEPYPTPPSPSAASDPTTTNTAPITVKEFSAFVLIVVLFAGSAAVSLTFALTITAWIVGSAIVLAIKIHRGSRKPPFPNGRVEFVSGFKKWMADSALWAAVGAAIFTLVVDFPALGLTGILLGAVLLRRMQQVVPDVVPLLMARFAPPQDSPTPHIVTAPTQAPYDFLATPVGNRLLTKSLVDLDLDSENWQVVGRPDNVQITLLTKNPNSGESVFLRIFASGQERSLEHEYALRSNLADPNPFHHKKVMKTMIAGLPAIMLAYSTDSTPNPAMAIDGKTAIKWQVEWEILCVESPSLQKDLAGYVVPDPKQFLLPLLITANGIRGTHQEPVSQLIDRFPTLRDHYIDGPRVIHFGGAVSNANMIALDETIIEPLDVRGWGVDLWGARWSDSEEFVNRLIAASDNHTHLTEHVPSLRIRFRTHILTRALRGKNLPSVTHQGEGLNALLHSDTDEH